MLLTSRMLRVIFFFTFQLYISSEQYTASKYNGFFGAHETHDVILWKPCFSKYQPVINFRTHEVQLQKKDLPTMSRTEKVTLKEMQCASQDEFAQKLKNHDYEKIYRVKISRIDKLFDSMAGKIWFSVIDLARG